MRAVVSRIFICVSLAAMLAPQFVGATILLHSAVGSTLQLAGVADCPATHDGSDSGEAMRSTVGETPEECCVHHDCACSMSHAFALTPAHACPAILQTVGHASVPNASMPAGSPDTLLRPPRF